LTAEGTLYTSTAELDEVTTSSIRMSDMSIYAKQFVEDVSLLVPMRYTSTGNIIVASSFDEITLVTDTSPVSINRIFEFLELNWNNVNIGGGGFQVHNSISSDGTLASSTDVYGGYIWNPTDSRWHNVINAKSLPSTLTEVNKSPGPWSFRIAYNNSNRLYSLWQGNLIRSDDKGASWVNTNYTAVPLADAPGNNGSWKLTGQSLAIDPVNADVVLVSSANSIRMSSDAGSTWTELTLGSGQPGLPGYAIAFDPNSSVVGGKTQGIYIFKYNTGLYQSTNGGSTWAAVSASSGTPPTTYQKLFVSPAGLVLVTAPTSAASSVINIYNPSTNGWTQTTISNAGTSAGNRKVMSIAWDPTNSNRAVACADTAVFLAQSTDGGVTWTGWKTHKSTVVDGVNRYLNVATDIPWLAYTNDNFKSSGDIFFDPTTSNKLCVGGGIGFFTTTFNGADGFEWTSQTKGMETMVANFGISLPNGPYILGVWDRDTFTMSDLSKSPSKQGTDATTIIANCWDIDYSGTTPSFVVKMTNVFLAGTWYERSGYSTDAGQTWKYWSASPTTYPVDITSANEGGCVAVSTSSNIIIFPTATSGYYTKNGGVTWNPITMNDGTSTVTSSDYTGFITQRGFQRKIACADRVRPGIFRVYNSSIRAGSTAVGYWESVDGGDTWTKVSGDIPGGPSKAAQSAKLRATPGIANDMWFVAGTLSSTYTSTAPGGVLSPLCHTTDGGRTWTIISTSKIQGVIDFAFGAPYPGSSSTYSIYALGYANSVFGVYRSDDIGANWIKISGAYPQGSMDITRTLFADMNNFGTVGIGFSGSSYTYYTTPNNGNLYMITAPIISQTGGVLSITSSTWASKSQGILTRAWDWYRANGIIKEGKFLLDDRGLPKIDSTTEAVITGTHNSSTYTLKSFDSDPNVLIYIKETVTIIGSYDSLTVRSNPIGNP